MCVTSITTYNIYSSTTTCADVYGYVDECVCWVVGIWHHPIDELRVYMCLLLT